MVFMTSPFPQPHLRGAKMKPRPADQASRVLSASGSVLIAAAREATLEDFEESR